MGISGKTNLEFALISSVAKSEYMIPASPLDDSFVGSNTLNSGVHLCYLTTYENLI